MRWLCLGLLALLNGLQAMLHSWGLAIVALSFAVKIATSPLTMIARRWQQEVNAIQSRSQPEIDAIKRQYKGGEQAERILAAHKAAGVTPFYTMRTTMGFLIQIPVLIAAFAVLNGAVGLNGAAFLWIDDLAQPDHIAALPITLPFFGGHLKSYCQY